MKKIIHNPRDFSIRQTHLKCVQNLLSKIINTEDNLNIKINGEDFAVCVFPITWMFLPPAFELIIIKLHEISHGRSLGWLDTSISHCSVILEMFLKWASSEGFPTSNSLRLWIAGVCQDWFRPFFGGVRGWREEGLPVWYISFLKLKTQGGKWAL